MMGLMTELRKAFCVTLLDCIVRSWPQSADSGRVFQCCADLAMAMGIDCGMTESQIRAGKDGKTPQS